MAKKTSNKACDVIIVGAGPTGLTLALDLQRRGINFRIIDKKSSFKKQPYAFLLHPKSLEIFYDLEVVNLMSEQGKRIYNLEGYIEKTKRFVLDFNSQEISSFTYALGLGQDQLENILVDQLASLGVDIEWKTEITKLKQNDKEAVVTLEKDGKNEEIPTRYVIGCDGQNSTVRNLINTPFKKTSIPDYILAADIEIESSVKPNAGYCFIEKSGMSILLPHNIEKTWRVTIPLQNQHTGDVSIEQLKTLFEKSSPAPMNFVDLKWGTFAEVQRGRAKRLRVKRTFLAGDAAHVHSPIGGQGINMGIQDAYNLGWKLAMYLNDEASEDILDSYESERGEVADLYLRSTNFALNLLNTRTPFLRKLRNFISVAFVNFPVAKNQVKTLCGDSFVRYRNSPLVDQENTTSTRYAHQLSESVVNSVYVGDFAPSLVLLSPAKYKKAYLHEIIKGPKHHLVVFLGDDPTILETAHARFQKIKRSLSDFADGVFIVGEHAIDFNAFNPKLSDVFLDPDGHGHTKYKCWEPTLFLIRPDGYVSYRGKLNDNSLFEYINKHFFKPEKVSKKSKAKRTG